MKTFISFFLGIMTWPLLEYLLHRYLGHVLKINTLFKQQHTRHHVETNYFAPLSYKILAAIPVCALTIILVSALARSWQTGVAFTIGFISMFSFYEWFHWSIHARAPKTKLGMKLRKHHLAHHFHNAKMNHGVTTTIIDKLTGSYLDAPVVKVPKNIPLPWLFIAGTDTIDPKFKADFQRR